MRYADDSSRSALLQRLLPLREREPYGAALGMRFASETQPDPIPLLPYVRCRAANFYGRPSARGRLRPRARHTTDPEREQRAQRPSLRRGVTTEPNPQLPWGERIQEGKTTGSDTL